MGKGNIPERKSMPKGVVFWGNVTFGSDYLFNHP